MPFNRFSRLKTNGEKLLSSVALAFPSNLGGLLYRCHFETSFHFKDQIKNVTRSSIVVEELKPLSLLAFIGLPACLSYASSSILIVVDIHWLSINSIFIPQFLTAPLLPTFLTLIVPMPSSLRTHKGEM